MWWMETTCKQVWRPQLSEHRTAKLSCRAVLCTEGARCMGQGSGTGHTSPAERGEAQRTVPEVMAKNRMTADVVDSAS